MGLLLNKNKLFLLFALLMCGRVYAGAGPEPTRRFEILMETSKKAELYKGYFFECKDNACSAFDTLKETSGQQFICNGSTCTAVAAGFSEYGKIAIRFSDKVRVSNVFTAKGYNASYTIHVLDDELVVEETTSFWRSTTDMADYFKFLLFSILLEIPFALILFRKWMVPLRHLVWVAVVNVFSLAIFQFVLLQFISSLVVAYAVGLLVVILLEAIALHFLSRKDLPMGKSLSLSIGANVLSFVVSGLLLLYFALFY